MELETHLIVAGHLCFLKPNESGAVARPVRDIEKMQNHLIAVLRKRRTTGRTLAGRTL